MADYTIIPRPDGTFDIGIAGHDGTRQTMLGFETETDVRNWIDQDRRLSSDDTAIDEWRNNN